MAILMTLYNMVLLERKATSKAIIHFMLFYAYLEAGAYNRAEEHLRAFQKEVSGCKWETNEEGKIRLFVQVLFCMLHESYHLLLHYKPEIKEQSLNQEIKRQKDIQEEWEHLWQSAGDKEKKFIIAETKRNMNILIPSDLPSEMKSEMETDVPKEVESNLLRANDYDELIKGNNPVLLEELICDRLAWVYIMEHFKTLGIEEDELLQLHSWAYISLNALDMDKAYNLWYRPRQNLRNQYDIKEVLLRHKSYRSLARHYITTDGAEPSAKYRQINSQVEEIFKEMSRNLYMNRDELIKLYQRKDEDFDNDREKTLRNEMNRIVASILQA